MRISKLCAVLFMIAIAAGISSCNNDDDAPAGNGPLFSAVIDGATFTAAATEAYIADGSVFINGTNGNKNVEIIIQGDTEGSYTGLNSLITFDPDVNQPYVYSSIGTSENTSSVIITDINTANQTISGTFSCTLYSPEHVDNPEIVLTNGTFTNIHYETEWP